jgi:hypothetical protein
MQVGYIKIQRWKSPYGRKQGNLRFKEKGREKQFYFGT